MGTCVYLLNSPLWVEDAELLEHFSHDRDSGVDRVGNHKNKSLGGRGRDSGGKIFNDTSVNLGITMSGCLA